MYFASDNTAPTHPDIMAAILRANEGYPRSYGADPLMDAVQGQIRNLFECPDAAVYLVATGTAANALAIASHVQPWQAVFCHEDAHIAVDECGAPEFYSGAKLALIPGPHGKITPEGLSHALTRTGNSGVHGVQRGMLSLTNVTEAGTLYTTAEIAALTALAKQHDLPCHLDGARFANALVALGCTPAEMTWKSGIDVVSFGGTKNGCMGVEAVVFFNPARAWASRPNSWATTWATLMYRPCPISVPPWFTCTDPSVYTCTRAPAWFRCLRVKAMPNFTGVRAMPFLSTGLVRLKRWMARRRAR